jgi:hypothetical protein
MYTNHDEIARLAYRFWEERGRPHGSSEADWYRAVDALRTHDAEERALPPVAGMRLWHETANRT